MSILSEALDRQLQKLMPEKFPASVKPVKTPKPAKADLRKVHLVFQEGSSDKEYIVNIVPVGNLYDVEFEYGRREGNHTKGTKNDRPVSLFQANSIFDKLVSDKKRKGYKEK